MSTRDKRKVKVVPRRPFVEVWLYLSSMAFIFPCQPLKYTAAIPQYITLWSFTVRYCQPVLKQEKCTSTFIFSSSMSFHLSIVTDLTKLNKNSTRTQFTIMIIIMIQLSIPHHRLPRSYFTFGRWRETAYWGGKLIRDGVLNFVLNLVLFNNTLMKITDPNQHCK